MATPKKQAENTSAKVAATGAQLYPSPTPVPNFFPESEKRGADLGGGGVLAVARPDRPDLVGHHPERDIGERIKGERERLGLNFEQFAAFTREYDAEGISAVTLRRYERTDEGRSFPDIRASRVLSECLGVSADYLLASEKPNNIAAERWHAFERDREARSVSGNWSSRYVDPRCQCANPTREQSAIRATGPRYRRRSRNAPGGAVSAKGSAEGARLQAGAITTTESRHTEPAHT